MNHTMEKVNVFKQIMGHYPTGITIITTINGNEEPAGLTVNSFTSVSIDPLLVLWCIDKKTSSFETFLQADGFAVHTLSSDQTEACWAFAGKSADRFMKVNYFRCLSRPEFSQILSIEDMGRYPFYNDFNFIY